MVVSLGDRYAIVRINDRGPFIRGRKLDLARGAAAGPTGRGVARVRMEPP